LVNGSSDGDAMDSKVIAQLQAQLRRAMLKRRREEEWGQRAKAKITHIKEAIEDIKLLNSLSSRICK
jgi:hypothetical protein